DGAAGIENAFGELGQAHRAGWDFKLCLNTSLRKIEDKGNGLEGFLLGGHTISGNAGVPARRIIKWPFPCVAGETRAPGRIISVRGTEVQFRSRPGSLHG